MYSSLLSRILLPAALATSRSAYLRIARQTARRQRWPAEDLTAWQLERLRGLVQHAVEHVPYYRERIGKTPELKSLADVEQLPMLTKKDVEASFPDQIVSDEFDREDARRYGSGGTTHRIVVLHDFQKRDYTRAAELITSTADCRYRIGKRSTSIPPDACSILCGIDGIRETSVSRHLWTMIARRKFRDAEARSDLRGLVMNNWIYRRKVLEPFGPDGTHISEERLDSYVSRLRAEKPYYLKALPEYLQALAQHVRRRGERPLRIPVVKPMGALMTPRMKQSVAESFLGEIREDFGSNELGPMAFDCRFRQGLHLLSDHYLFEFVRAGDGRPAADGEPAKLLVTDLHNRAMPLIRYEIGDIVRVDRSPCRCGRTTPRITVEGRVQDTIVTSDGRVLTPRMIYEFLYSQPGIDQFQLIERSPQRFELSYVSAGKPLEASDVAEAFQAFSGDPRRLSVREVDSILPETSGKFRHVKSRSFDRFDTLDGPQKENAAAAKTQECLKP